MDDILPLYARGGRGFTRSEVPMKPSYRPEDIYHWMEPSPSRDRSAITSYLHDRDAEIPVVKVAEATGIPEAQVKVYLLELREVGAVDFLGEDRWEWLGTLLNLVHVLDPSRPDSDTNATLETFRPVLA